MIIELALGLAVGAVMALTGAGGGILAVPLLVFILKLNVVQAAPVGLLAVGIAAALGAAHGLKEGIVRYRAALLMGSVGMLLAPVGIWLARRVDNRWLSAVFAIVLLLVAYRALRDARNAPDESEQQRQALCMRSSATGRFVWSASCARALALSGGLAGLLSGLLGVGGGFVIVPSLKRHSDLTMHSITSTSLAVIALVSFSGIVSSVSSGNLNWSIALPFAAGALAGMLAGRMIASRLPGPQMQKGFGAVSALVAIGMVMKSLAG
ncbi:MAG TPA: sulfite exporter TauE/SafE family protein [Burkholderiaceae bacterium]|nr:sulfite exporter TauE/SafE family protein [Burkholderiaceae bacterium]